jgi:hypothetical protein
LAQRTLQTLKIDRAPGNSHELAAAGLRIMEHGSFLPVHGVLWAMQNIRCLEEIVP